MDWNDGLDGVTRVANYAVRKLIGCGAHGAVYLGSKLGEAGDVVVKRAHAPADVPIADAALGLYLREVRLTKLLEHPSCVRILDVAVETFDAVEGTPERIGCSLVVEPFEGLDLQRFARASWALGQPLPVEVIVGVFVELARAMQVAHDRRGRQDALIHRASTPDNLFLTTSGAAKLLDTGHPHAPDRESTFGAQTCKADFLAPEQIRGEPLDGRADVFTLGVSLFWLLTGALPFHGANDMDTMERILAGVPSRPRNHNATVPKALEEIVLWLLETRPEARPRSASVAAEALAGVQGFELDPLGVGRGVATLAASTGVQRARRDWTSPIACAASASLALIDAWSPGGRALWAAARARPIEALQREHPTSGSTFEPLAANAVAPAEEKRSLVEHLGAQLRTRLERPSDDLSSSPFDVTVFESEPTDELHATTTAASAELWKKLVDVFQPGSTIAAPLDSETMDDTLRSG